MEQLATAAFTDLGAPAIAAAILAVLLKMNSTLTAQKEATLRLIHELDKRVAVIEAKGV